MPDFQQRFGFNVVDLADVVRTELYSMRLSATQKYLDMLGRERTKIYPPDMGGFRFDPKSKLVFYRFAYWKGDSITNPTPADFKRAQADYHLSRRLGLPVRVQYSERDGIFVGVALDGNPENFLPPSKRSGYLSPKAAEAAQVIFQPEEIAQPIPEVVGFEYIGNPYAGGELSFTLGAGAGGRLLTATLEDMNNILVAGKSKSGKSTFLRNLLTQALVAELQRGENEPPRVQVGMIDLEQITFNGELFRGLPQVFGKGVVTTEAEVLRFLTGLEGEINRRQALYQLAPGLPESLKDFNQVVRANQKLPVLLVFVEEITALAGLLKVKLLEPLQRLIIRCRKYGVYFILSGQNFRAEVIDKVISETCDASFLFGEATGETMRVLNFEAKHRLTEYHRGRGIARLFGQTGVQEFQGIYLPKPNFMTLVNHFRGMSGLPEVGRANNLDRVEAVTVRQLTPEQTLVYNLLMHHQLTTLNGLHQKLMGMGYSVSVTVVQQIVQQLINLGKIQVTGLPTPEKQTMVQSTASAVQELSQAGATVTEAVGTGRAATEGQATLETKALPEQPSRVVIPEELSGVVASWKGGATSIRKMAAALGCGKSKAAELMSRARGMGLLNGSDAAGFAA